MHPGPASPSGDGTPPGPPVPPAPGVYEAPTQQYDGYGRPEYARQPYGAPAAAAGSPSYSPAAPPAGGNGYPAQPRFDGVPPGRPAGPRTPTQPRPPVPSSRPQYAVARGIVAFLCLMLTVLLTIPAVSASWLKEELISDSGFADNAAALIEEPAIRAEIQSRIANEVVNRSGLPAEMRGTVMSAVGAVMGTDEFRTVWKEGAATAHNVVVNSLLGKDSEFVDSNNGELTIKVRTPLGPLFEELTKAGVRINQNELPAEIPVPLADIPSSGPAQDTLRGIDDAGWMLPALAIALLVVGVGIAVHRLRALALTAVGTLVMGGLLLVITNLARSPVVDEATKGSDLSSEATGAVYDVFTDTLVTDAWIVIVISIVGLAGTAIVGAFLRNRRAA